MPRRITRSMAVKELPDGYFKEQLLKLAATPETPVLIVAVIGYANDWTACIGWPLDLSGYGRRQDPSGYYQATFNDYEGVANSGDKLDEDTARAIFNNDILKSFHYRS